MLKPGDNPRLLMMVMDNLKALGFDHTRDRNYDLFVRHMDMLDEQGLSWRMHEQAEVLTRIGVLQNPKVDTNGRTSINRREFYNRFFQFWRKATANLLAQSTFTFEDQKYWTYLGPEGGRV